MAWIEISISVDRNAAAAAELTLEQLGALAITLEDDEDNPVLEPGPGMIPLWPTVQIRGLFEADIDRRRVLESLRVIPGADRPDGFCWLEVEDQDWERAWMERFAPMRFGKRLWIVPGGMQIPFDPEQVEIRLDPGLAFGTGTHPTTALCLEWLDGQDIRNKTVIDYGCGSGILGIAAALKGAARVLCVDNDPQALEATADNAARNRVTGRIERHTPDTFPDLLADVVMANILAAPLISLAPHLLGSLSAGGKLVLSGILEEQTEEVLAAYRGGLGSLGIESREEWMLIEGVRVSQLPGEPGG